MIIANSSEFLVRIYPNSELRKILLMGTILVMTAVILSACIPTLNTGQSAAREGEFVKGKIVKGFGGNVPLYKEAQVIETFASESSYGGSFVTDDNLSRVYKYYQEVLPQLGWESQVRQQAENNYIFEIKNSQYRGKIIVNIAGDGEKTALTIAVSAR